MNQNMNDRSSFYIIGKEFIIVLVVVFSAVSFTLGYLVGKSLHADRERVTVEIADELTAQSDHSTVHVQDSKSPVIAARDFIPSENHESSQHDGLEAASSMKKTSSSMRDAYSASENEGTHDPIIYTIQLGAFRNSEDADNFKTKYQDKGYSTYITVFRNNSGENVYKVRMGSFKTRKEADLFSVKLKKTEGLSAFVTFKKN